MSRSAFWFSILSGKWLNQWAWVHRLESGWWRTSFDLLVLFSLLFIYLFIYFLQFSVKTENPFGFGFSFGFCFLILFDLMESGKGCLWLSGIGGSIAYNWSQPGMKTSVKIIHARYGLFYFYFYFFCFLYLLCLFAFVWVVVELCGSEAPSVCFSGKNGEGKWLNKEALSFFFFFEKFSTFNVSKSNKQEATLTPSALTLHLKMKF